MGRLGGFRYREIVRKLRASGFEFDRQAAGSHEIWYNATTRRYTTVPNHPGNMPEGTLRSILKQAGIDPETFYSSNTRTKFRALPNRVRPDLLSRQVMLVLRSIEGDLPSCGQPAC